MMERNYQYLSELSGRICGICTAAHELCSVIPVKKAVGIEVPEEVKKLRELMLISTHIQSYVLHLYFLALPDYINAESILEMANRDINLVKKGI